MSEWPILTVQQLVDSGILGERPMDGNHGSIHPKSSDFVASGIPFVMASDLSDGCVKLDDCAFISEEQARGLAKGFSLPGDVLLSHKATIGRTAIVQENDFPFIMLTPQITYYRIKNKNALNNRFLKYYFDSKSFKDVFEAWAGGGSTRAYLGITAQGKLPVPVPSIKIQLEIADTIGPLDDKIDLNRRMNETLETMARAIFKDWFVDFGPTRAKMEGRAPYLSPEVWGLFPDRLDASRVPERWRFEPLLDHANLVSGGTPKTDEVAYWNGSIAWASAKDVSQCGDTFLIATERAITERGLTESSTRMVPKFATVVVARGATTGRFRMLGRHMAMNQNLLRSGFSVRPAFLGELRFWQSRRRAIKRSTRVRFRHDYHCDYRSHKSFNL